LRVLCIFVAETAFLTTTLCFFCISDTTTHDASEKHQNQRQSYVKHISTGLFYANESCDSPVTIIHGIAVERDIFLRKAG
jgi:hypothetical protein